MIYCLIFMSLIIFSLTIILSCKNDKINYCLFFMSFLVILFSMSLMSLSQKDNDISYGLIFISFMLVFSSIIILHKNDNDIAMKHYGFCNCLAFFMFFMGVHPILSSLGIKNQIINFSLSAFLDCICIFSITAILVIIQTNRENKR